MLEKITYFYIDIPHKMLCMSIAVHVIWQEISTKQASLCHLSH